MPGIVFHLPWSFMMPKMLMMKKSIKRSRTLGNLLGLVVLAEAQCKKLKIIFIKVK